MNLRAYITTRRKLIAANRKLADLVNSHKQAEEGIALHYAQMREHAYSLNRDNERLQERIQKLLKTLQESRRYHHIIIHRED